MSDDLRDDICFSTELRGQSLTFNTTWGLFSPRQIDEGSWLLLKHLAIGKRETCLDLGCGYGPIGITVACQYPDSTVHMVDKDFVAVDYARRNAERNGALNTEIYLSNGLSAVPPGLMFDTIMANLPSNTGKELLQIILQDACARLKPGGQLVAVTITGLREFIKRHLRDVFGNYTKIKQQRTYTVARALKPVPEDENGSSAG